MLTKEEPAQVADDRAFIVLYAQTQVLSERIDHTNELLERIANELSADRRRNEARLEALARRQQQIILYMAVGIAVIVTAALGPNALLRAIANAAL